MSSELKSRQGQKTDRISGKALVIGQRARVKRSLGTGIAHKGWLYDHTPSRQFQWHFWPDAWKDCAGFACTEDELEPLEGNCRVQGLQVGRRVLVVELFGTDTKHGVIYGYCPDRAYPWLVMLEEWGKRKIGIACKACELVPMQHAPAQLQQKK